MTNKTSGVTIKYLRKICWIYTSSS